MSVQSTVEIYEETAERWLRLSKLIMAASIALEEGELTEEEAEEMVMLGKKSDLKLVQSDVYPGDEYFDRAAHRLNSDL